MSRIVLGVLLSFSLAASAAVVVQQEGTDLNTKQKIKTTLTVDNGKLRVETSQGNSKTVMIFDGDKQVMYMIQPDQGSYMEITEADVQRLSQMAGGAAAAMQSDPRMADAMKQMQDKMASMTPQQRAMVEQAMKGRGGMGMPGSAAPSAPPKITFEAKGGSDKVGEFDCKKYEQLSDGKRVAELCAASYDQVHLTAADIKSFQEMAKFWEPMRKMSARGGWSAPPTEQLHGFPVRTTTYDGDKPTFESVILSVEQKSSDASLFVVPSGLKKNSMMGR